jgi:hypothetical protein
VKSFVPDSTGRVWLADVDEVTAAAGEAVVAVEAGTTSSWSPEIGTPLPWERTPAVVDAIRQRRGNAVLTLN